MAPPTGKTNPFDDDEEGAGNVNTSFRVNSSNPFDSQADESYDVSINPASEETYEDMNSDLPVEASWQYLGDLPYRRIPIYSDIRWNKDDEDDFGLASYSASFKQQQRSSLLDAQDVQALLSTSSVTKVSGCPNGGPIATITLPVLGDSMKSAQLRIITNAGQHLASIDLPPRQLAKKYSAADIMSIGFTDRTVLIILFRDSLCLTYDLRGEPILPAFHILPKGEGRGTELVHCSIFEGGVAVLSPKMQCAIVELLDENDDPSYANAAHLGSRRISPSLNNTVASRASGEMFGGTDSQPLNYAIVTPLPTSAFCQEHLYSFVSIAVLPRIHTTSRHPEVFLSTSDNSVVVVNAATTDITDVDCRARIKSPIVAMSFAPNGRFLACFTQSSILTVISTSFETKVLDFDTSEGSQNPPSDMKWCGEDSVVLHWKKLGILMVGPYGDWLRFPFENTENVWIVPEIDCCRVVTDNSIEILQRVPPATAALLRMGSIEPSAMLLDASDAFDSGSPSSDEAARAITKTGMLLEAIETCMDAATREYNIDMQKRLLRAASYGMHFSYKDPNRSTIMGGSTFANENNDFMPSNPAIKFTATARKLRILNALRDPRIGSVMTTLQYDHITPTGVIARLVAINRPALACSISKYLNLSNDVQLYARCAKAAALISSDKFKSDAETAEVAIKIINDGKDGAMNNGGYASVALAAGKAGRPGVANLLLMLESSVADKVPALISTGSFADAMAVATSAKDAEFIFFTLMEYEKFCMSSSPDANVAQNTFLGTVINKFTPEGFHTLRRYLETMPDIKNLMNLLLRAQKSVEAGAAMSKKAFEPENETPEKLKFLAEASRIYSLGKDTGFQKQCTDEHMDLLKDQEVLRKKYGTEEVAPIGSSLTTTVVSIIRHAAVNKRESHKLLGDVDKLAKKFRMPEKRVWHIKVKAFAESGQWPQLRKLGDSKAKPPIGFKPFAMAAIQGKQSDPEIMRYIDRVTISEERYDLFCEAKLWKRALEEAGKLRDTRRVANVRSSCNSADIGQLADDMLNRLSTM
mmetsp:Transcript_17132/g.25327  ORF Transcript_17132/g.25327 Transcript_17132/m.25327 type:complete len:1041 (+) Transcript_17132:101-3223(+)